MAALTILKLFILFLVLMSLSLEIYADLPKSGKPAENLNAILHVESQRVGNQGSTLSDKHQQEASKAQEDPEIHNAKNVLPADPDPTSSSQKEDVDFVNMKEVYKPHNGEDAGVKGKDAGGAREDEPDSEQGKVRERRAVPCQHSPPSATNHNCIACNGETTFLHTDDKGYTCLCGLCRPGRYMHTPCTCTADHQEANQTNCIIPGRGKGFMNESNWCDQPYPCTECEGDLRLVNKKLECGGADDRKCDCPDGQYQTGPTKCQDIPHCQKDHQSHRVPVPGSPYMTYKCEPCDDGYIQPFNDSLEKCRPVENTSDKPDNPPDKGNTKSDGTEMNTSQGGTISPAPTETNSPPSKQTESTNCSCICSTNETKNNEKNTSGNETRNEEKTHHNNKCDFFRHRAAIVSLLILLFFVIPICLACGAVHNKTVTGYMHLGRMHNTGSLKKIPSLQEVISQTIGSKDTDHLNPDENSNSQDKLANPGENQTMSGSDIPLLSNDDQLEETTRKRTKSTSEGTSGGTSEK